MFYSLIDENFFLYSVYWVNYSKIICKELGKDSKNERKMFRKEFEKDLKRIDKDFEKNSKRVR